MLLYAHGCLQALHGAYCQQSPNMSYICEESVKSLLRSCWCARHVLLCCVITGDFTEQQAGKAGSIRGPLSMPPWCVLLTGLFATC